jgi:hypothetical protein
MWRGGSVRDCLLEHDVRLLVEDIRLAASLPASRPPMPLCIPGTSFDTSTAELHLALPVNRGHR